MPAAGGTHTAPLLRAAVAPGRPTLSSGGAAMSESDLRVGRTGFTRPEVILMVELLVFGLVVSALCTLLLYDRFLEVAKLFAAGGITLFFGAIFGGVVKLLIDNFDRRRAQRAAQVDF